MASALESCINCGQYLGAASETGVMLTEWGYLPNQSRLPQSAIKRGGTPMTGLQEERGGNLRNANGNPVTEKVNSCQ